MIKSNNQFSDIKNSDLDFGIDPAKDFYNFVNNNWKNHHPIPSDKSRYGIFDILTEKNEILIRKILENSSDRRKTKRSKLEIQLGNLYRSGMNTRKIESIGIKALSDKINLINNLRRKSELVGILSYLHKFKISPVFYFYGSPDPGDCEVNIAHISQGGLGLSDRDYYLNDDKYSVELRTEYIKHMIKMLSLSGIPESDAKIYSDNIIKFETRLAACSMSRLELRDPHKTYNKRSLKELVRLSPEFNWEEYFKQIGCSGIDKINVCQPEFLKTFNLMISDESLKFWKMYLLWYLINSSAPYLSSDFVKENFNFYGKIVSGKKKLPARWKRVLKVCNTYLGDSVGQIFIKQHFSQKSKLKMLELVSNLKSAFKSRITKLDWMSQETKNKALEKLDLMRVKIGYPDKWKDYSEMIISKDSYYNNVLNGKKYAFEYLINKIGKPVDKSDWEINAQTVNAYYNPLLNEIVFPAAILQAPFYYPEDDDAINYGAIGMVIGHEMTHGFDDQGKQYDKTGNLKNWWTRDDSKNFNKRSKILIEQFNSYTVLEEIYADGKLSLGENIADLGGLKIAIDAYLLTKNENKTKRVSGSFTGIQKFFLSYSRIWAQNIRYKELIRLTKEDVHSIGKLRVNGPLSNMEEFHRAFNVKPGDKMYISSKKRARIW